MSHAHPDGGTRWTTFNTMLAYWAASSLMYGGCPAFARWVLRA